jgi:cell filamentation protein, protein adenylyltransferase
MARRTPPGRKVRRPEGYSAFVPDPLPPAIEWTHELVAALSEADRQVGRLAGEGRQLPNPHLLIRPFVRREAVLSSRIEGTQATLGELLAAEAGAVVERSPDDLREVANYVTALEHGMARLKRLPLSLRLVRELHAKLMTGVRGDRAPPGEFRRTQNWVGPAGATPATASYVPPPPEELMACLGPWETFLHERALPPLVHVALAHYQFEAIHPFLDGNGRVGRLLITLSMLERSILPAPLLYLSAYFEATRAEYYARLRAVQEAAEWEAWVRYFLAGVAHQSADAVRRAEQVNSLLAEWRRRLADAPSPAATRLIDLLAENPYWTVPRTASRLGVAFTTAQRAVERLRAASIVTQVGEARRDRVYCATDLLKILEAPSASAPGKRP